MEELNEMRRKAQELIDLDAPSVAEYVPVWNEYIQAANPIAVLSLLSRLEQAEQAVAMVRAEAQELVNMNEPAGENFLSILDGDTRRLADQGLGDNLARTTKNGDNNA